MTKYEFRTSEEFAREHRYHGVYCSQWDGKKDWVFYRDGERCRTFAYLERSK